MAQIRYPPPYAQRVLALEAPGGPPTRAYVVAPTITAPGRAFTLKVALLDKNTFASVESDAAVRIRASFAEPPEIDVPFRRGAPAIAFVQGVAAQSEGLFRFKADFDGKTFTSNPTRCTGQPSPAIYWGDPHIHTTLSRCHPGLCRSLNFCYVASRYLAGLDWASAADHVSNGRSDLGKWREQIAAWRLYYAPGEFVTLPAYEASFKGFAGGDNNVYMLRWPDIFVEDYEQGTVKTMADRLLHKLPASNFFIVPHHTSRPNKHGEMPDEIYPGPELMPVIEVHSKWGTSEYRGNPNALHKLHDGPSYAVDLLNKGLMMGFVGGTDTHCTMPGGLGRGEAEPGRHDRHGAMTAVFAYELTRQAVYRSVRSRRCYATSLERIYLDATVAGAGQGAKLPWQGSSRPRDVKVAAAGESDIATIDVVRNGRTIHSAKVNAWQGRLEFADEEALNGVCLESKHLGRFAYYYVRVTCVSGAQAWSSPVWLVL